MRDKNEPLPFLISYIKINLKQIIYINENLKLLRLLEENCCDLGLRKISQYTENIK